MTVISQLPTQVTPDSSAAREALSKSLARLTAGSKTAPAAAPSADAAVGLSLHARIRGISDAQQQVGEALSFTQSQSAYLARTSAALERMAKLAGWAQSDTVSGTERADHEGEFSGLNEAVASYTTKDFNGVSLFSQNTLQVALDSTGDTLSLAGVPLDLRAYKDALRGTSLRSVADAQETFAKLQLAGQRLNQDRAVVEDNEARLHAAATRLAVSRENLDAATADIEDADTAKQSAQLAGENFVAQPRAAMLAQANAMPQSALRLLP